MRVLVVTVVHTPTDARIFHRQIRALTTAGHHVTFIAPFAGYNLDADTFAGQRRLAVINVTRADGKKRVRALLHAKRLIKTHAPHHDVILLHDPELLFIAAKRVTKHTPVVYDVHEHAAAALTERTYLPKVLRNPVARFVARKERQAEKRHSLILAEPAYQQRFEKKHAVVENLPWAVYNPQPAASVNQVVYVGRISLLRGADEMLALAARLHAANGPTLTLIGPADSDVADALTRAHDAGLLVWHGALPNNVALTTMAGAVAGLSLLHDTANYRVSRPTKLLEYFVHRIPVITTPLPEAVKLTQKAGSGTVVAYGQDGADAAFTQIMRYHAHPEEAVHDGDTGYKWVVAHATFDRHADTFVNVLKKACT